MNRLVSLALAFSLTVTLFGCPTRPGSNADGADSAGSDGSSAGVDGSFGGQSGGAAGSGGVIKDGQPCFVGGDCASGTCSPFYVDVDGDGYGTGQAMGFCGTTPPVGYAAQSGDCCDNATNLAVAKLIHPGADFQTTSAGGACGITWDYDCSGTVESNPQTVACPSSPPCTATTVSYDESQCGTADTEGCNCSSAGSGCVTACVGHPAVPIGCK